MDVNAAPGQLILGAHATPEIEASVENLLNEHAELRHVEIIRATIDLEARSVNVSWADRRITS